ncbi:hypothetical protein Tco_0148870 [Tanacetum coccineum]
MGGSSSQRHTDPTMSPIHAFSIEDVYTPEFSDSFQQGSFQETAREDSPIAWTNEEEIALYKGWVYESGASDEDYVDPNGRNFVNTKEYAESTL